MGKRGQKPIDLGELNFWEFEFYKVFRLLRDGTSLPGRYTTRSGLSRSEVHAFIAQLKNMAPADYYLTAQRVAKELGQSVNLNRPPTSMDLWWAEDQRKEELHWLERELSPPKIAAQEKRRKIWNDLVYANTYAALRKACGRWAQLPDVRGAGLTCYAEHVLSHASHFLAMKKNDRFPRSDYADDARLEYLARGMAGAISGRSPMTGIERLRNMKHDANGPLWVKQNGNAVLPADHQYCACWRCRIENSNRVTEITRAGYEEGLRLFIGIANTTKAPKEWNRRGTSRMRP